MNDEYDPKALRDAIVKAERKALGADLIPDEELRMDAYYYGFHRTGVIEIDRILSAVARAGKAFHLTEDWNEPAYGGDTSPVDWIQNAANDAAAARRVSPVTREALEDELKKELLEHVAHPASGKCACGYQYENPRPSHEAVATHIAESMASSMSISTPNSMIREGIVNELFAHAELDEPERGE